MWLVSSGAVSEDIPFQLKPGSYLLGRSAKCDIVLWDSSISLRHARIAVQLDGTAEITDLGSSNGIFVNDEKVDSAVITQGTRIRLGVLIGRIAARPQQLLQKADNDADEEPTLPCPPRKDQATNALVNLTEKKKAIADLLARGYRQETIAMLRGISFHTAHNHVRELYRVFQVNSLLHFLAKYHARKAAGNDKEEDQP